MSVTPPASSGYRLPRWFPLIVTILGMATMATLSVWQIQRLEWKKDLIARMEEAKLQPETTLDPTAPAESLKALEYRPVRVSGTFVPGKEYHLGARYLNGRLGYTIAAPLNVADDAPLLLVERGWVPVDKKELATRPDSLPTGPVTLHGTVRLPIQPKWMTPENQPAKNFWFYLDEKTIAADLGRKVAPVIFQVVGKPDGDALPVPNDGVIEVRNDHLGYAITWALIGIGAGVIYWISRRKRPNI